MEASRRTGIACLLVTAIGWGLAWPVMKELLRETTPLVARGLSGMISAALLALLAMALKQSLRVPRGLGPRLGLAAFVNVFVWMGCSSVALRWLHAGEGALLVYTMPVWATFFAWPVAGERPTRRTVAALALCAAGLWLLFGSDLASTGPLHAIGVALALAAAVTFAFGTVALRPLEGMSPLAVVVWQMLIGCGPMLAIGFGFEGIDGFRPSAAGWARFAYMTLIPMGACYLAWFAALRRLPATMAASTTLLVPAIGVVSSAIALDEPLGPRAWLALVLTLAGVALALRRAPSATIEEAPA